MNVANKVVKVIKNDVPLKSIEQTHIILDEADIKWYTSQTVHHPSKFLHLEYSKWDYTKFNLVFFPIHIREYIDDNGHPKKYILFPDAWQQLQHSTTLFRAPYYEFHNSLAILTGTKSNLFVLDFDLNKDDATKKYYDRLVKQHGAPDTLLVTTGNLGVHWYFLLPTKTTTIRTTTGLNGYHIDSRGENGYIVAPFSKYRTYDHQHDKWYLPHGRFDDIKEAPEWIFQEFPSSVGQE